ncbi:MAG: hypothetical protein HON10_00185 [Euryarchaeota archaeon]|jgi:hypothetical protein|nr:hypothetical protein [Euryarchaeota archaeon]MBT7987495.1 hypothetical protein [Euryarchaeota archaeon]
MREVTLFWKRTRLANLDLGGIVDIFNQLEFISYVKRVPKDIRIILKANFCEGRSPKDIEDLHFLELLEVILEPKDNSDSYILLVKLNHSVSNLNARTNGTSAVPGCRLDGEGLTYIIQGPPLKLRLVSTLARLISQPDRISARSLDFNSTLDRSVLNTKQLKLAKFAYDRGYFDIPKRTRISDLATEIGLARATISEHLARIESILMDDMFSSFDEIYTDPKVVKNLIETVVLESESEELDITDNMVQLLNNIKKSIKTQLGNLNEDLYEGITGEEMIELAVKEHQENLSYIDDVIEEKLTSSSN